MEALHALDAEFLHLEDPVNLLHIGVCAVFDGPCPGDHEVRALVAAALPRIPRYRQRLRRAPLDLGRPAWEDDPDFHLDDHVFSSHLAQPGDRALQDLVAEIMETALDRRHPLWELWVVDGLGDGRWAMIAKVHHSVVDGVGGVDLLTVLLSVDPEELPPDWEPEPPRSDTAVTVSALGDLARPVLATPVWLARRVAHPVESARGLWSLAAGVGHWAGILWPARVTSVDGPVGRERTVAWAQVGLADAKAIRAERGGTVNDVVLCAVTRGFRDLLVHRGEDPRQADLRTVIPVSVRTGDAVDNEVSAVVAELPVVFTQPELRYAAVRAETDRLKGSHEAEAGEAVTGLADWLPPPVLAAATRAVGALLRRRPQRNIGTVVTNVPGPQHPLFAAGRRLLATHPYVPVAFGVRITVGVLSYDGTLWFGLTGDRASTPDLDVLARGIEADVADLLARSAG